MTIELAGSLILLALVDSLSVGTLVIPIFFLLAPRLRAGRILLYLFAIAAFYLLVGIAIAAGANTIMGGVAAVLATRPAQIVQLVLGVGLILLSFWIGRKKPDQDGGQPGRLARWRDRAMGDEGAGAALIVLAIGAGLAELATMLPYLGAIGMITVSPLDTPARILVLIGYCLTMIAPAVLLTLVRLIAGHRVEPLLTRLADWMQKNAAENTAWIVGIVGFLIARDAAVLLGLFGADGVQR